MSEYDPNEVASADETVPIQVDTLGIKKLRPRHDFDDSQITLESLKRDTQQSLLRIARDLLGCVADIFTGARNFIRGTGAIPGAVAERIGRSHELAERAEANAEVDAECEPSVDALANAMNRVGDVLGKLQADGIVTSISVTPSGTVLISAVRPEHADTATQIALEAAERVKNETIVVHSTSEANPLNESVQSLMVANYLKDKLFSFGLLHISDLIKMRTEFALDNFIADELLELRVALEVRGIHVRMFSALDRFYDTYLTRLPLSKQAQEDLAFVGVKTVREYFDSIHSAADADKIIADDVLVEIRREVYALLPRIASSKNVPFDAQL